MHKKVLSLCIALLLLLPLMAPLPAVAEGKEVGASPAYWSKTTPELRSVLLEGAEPGDLAVFGNYVRGFVLTEAGVVEGLREHGRVIYALPQVRKRTAVLMMIERSSVEKILSLPYVSFFLPDVKVRFDDPRRLDDSEILDARDMAITMYKVREILGVKRVFEEFGLDGSEIVVGVVDTGVDYGVPDIAHTLKIDEHGNPLVLDADAAGLVYPFYPVEIVDNMLPAKGRWFLTWSTIGTWTGIATGIPLGFFNVTVPKDINVTGVVSKSGILKLGIATQFNIMSWRYARVPFIHVPVIYADSETAGVYDTVYVDVSTAFAMVFGLQPDYSFADERPLKKGDVAVADYTGDGVPDASLGVVGGYFLDWMGFFGGGFRLGWSERGDYLNLFYDFDGHGTSCAANIASRGAVEFDIPKVSKKRLPGVAPATKIAGVLALWNGFTEAGWLWLAGFDIVDGMFLYTGEVRAEIVSNSWGISYQLYDAFGFGYDFVSTIQNALSLPGYLDPRYPGVLMVHAGGNGGPGYGTITSSGASTLALTVGASTSWHILVRFRHYEGHYDDVISWSLRGPTPVGEVKPDVLNVGAFAFVATSLWWGEGDGAKAWDIFGGTSQSCPLTAGIAALLLQAYKVKGVEYTPSMLKATIMGTAVDTNNDPWMQGAGRADAYRAVSTVYMKPSLTSFSLDTAQRMSEILEAAWMRIFGVGMLLPPEPVYYGSIFAGRVMPGDSVELKSVAKYYGAEPTRVTVQSYVLKKVSEFTLTGVAPKIHVLDPKVFEGADLVTVNLFYDFSYFDHDLNYVWSNALFLIFSEWIDLDKDKVVDPPGELARFNIGYSLGATQEITVNNPYERMYSKENMIVIAISRFVSPREVPLKIPYTVVVSNYVKAEWGWITLPEKEFVLEPGKAREWRAILTVPKDALPAYYSGFIFLKARDASTLVPVSVVVPTDAEVLFRGEARAEEPYDPYVVKGMFDWWWRYESGDWRFFALSVEDLFLEKLLVRVEWETGRTCIDVFVLGPTGAFIGFTDLGSYIGMGRFLWHSTTGEETATVATCYPAWSQIPSPGIYTIYLHNVLYSGEKLAEAFKITVIKVPSVVHEFTTGFAPSSFYAETAVSASAHDPILWPLLVAFAQYPVRVIAYGPLLPDMVLHDLRLYLLVRLPPGAEPGTYYSVMVLYGIRFAPLFVIFKHMPLTFIREYLYATTVAVAITFE